MLPVPTDESEGVFLSAGDGTKIFVHTCLPADEVPARRSQSNGYNTGLDICHLERVRDFLPKVKIGAFFVSFCLFEGA